MIVDSSLATGIRQPAGDRQITLALERLNGRAGCRIVVCRSVRSGRSRNPTARAARSSDGAIAGRHRRYRCRRRDSFDRRAAHRHHRSRRNRAPAAPGAGRGDGAGLAGVRTMARSSSSFGSIATLAMRVLREILRGPRWSSDPRCVGGAVIAAASCQLFLNFDDEFGFRLRLRIRPQPEPMPVRAGTAAAVGARTIGRSGADAASPASVGLVRARRFFGVACCATGRGLNGISGAGCGAGLQEQRIDQDRQTAERRQRKAGRIERTARGELGTGGEPGHAGEATGFFFLVASERRPRV